MYHGSIDNNGNIVTAFAHSNDFSAAKVEVGKDHHYEITFNQWTMYKPTLAITMAPDEKGGPSLKYTYKLEDRTDVGNRWVAKVIPDNPSADHNGISFHARTGMRRIFDADDLTGDDNELTLEPEVITFHTVDGNGIAKDVKVLVLKTNESVLKMGSDALYLDKGTALVGVGSKMRLKLKTLVAEDPDDSTKKWDLTGWTYGLGSASADKWKTAGTGDDTYAYYDLSIDHTDDNAGPATPPYLFAVKAKPQAGNTHGYLSTDPLVRLSGVAPGGLASVRSPGT